MRRIGNKILLIFNLKINRLIDPNFKIKIHPMKKLFIYLSIVPFLFSCQKKNSEVQIKSPDAEITNVLEKFYQQYGKSSAALYEQPIAKDLFTPQIREEIEEIVSASKEDIEHIRKSSHPDDKPLLLEGSVFTSLYEGYTSYHVQSINTRNMKPDVKVADATVAFENAAVSPKIVWKENVHLINPSGSVWQIDNITFDKIAQVKDLKTRLNNLRAEFKK